MARGRQKKRKILNWILYTVLVSFPTIWFTVIIPYYGGLLNLTKIVDEQPRFTPLGVISVILVGIIILCIMYNNDKRNVHLEINDLENEITYLRTIYDSVDRICDEKYSQLQKCINEIKNEDIEAPKIVSNPTNQLKNILNGITSCLLQLMETPNETFSYKDFHVTLTYNFPMENSDWAWTDGVSEKDISLEELLMENAKSTFNYLRNNNKPYYFNNRKEDAKREDRYMYNPQDELSADTGESVGSIFCFNYKIKRGRKLYIHAILSISTQKKRFVPDNDEEHVKNLKDNLVSLVRDYFGKRIGIELSLLYLEYLKNKSSDNSTT